MHRKSGLQPIADEIGAMVHKRKLIPELNEIYRKAGNRLDRLNHEYRKWLRGEPSKWNPEWGEEFFYNPLVQECYYWLEMPFLKREQQLEALEMLKSGKTSPTRDIRSMIREAIQKNDAENKEKLEKEKAVQEAARKEKERQERLRRLEATSGNSHLEEV